jgi:hypothetical protein
VALRLNPSDATAHYNLGILCKPKVKPGLQRNLWSLRAGAAKQRSVGAQIRVRA